MSIDVDGPRPKSMLPVGLSIGRVAARLLLLLTARADDTSLSKVIVIHVTIGATHGSNLLLIHS